MQVRLGLSNFMQIKHAHEHFDLTSKNENFSIIWHKTIYFLDQEYMLSHKPHPSQREDLVTLQPSSYRQGMQLSNTVVR